MATSSPRRMQGRTLIDHDPDQLVWALGARESKVDPKRVDRDARESAKVGRQLRDLRTFALGIGGRIAYEVPESNVSSFKRRRVLLPDGTYGYRVVRPDWEAILTRLRRGECNALAVVDIDRATRDPRILEDLIDVVEMYGAYIVSITGNIDLSTDAGIAAARNLVSQRNAESRNTSRRVTDGKLEAAMNGGKNGGPNRSFGWRQDRLRINKREQAHIMREVPRIISGVSPLTIAREWNDRGVPTVNGGQWRSATVRNMFLRPRMCGMVVYRDAVLRDADDVPVRGQWEPMMTDEQHAAILRAWGPSPAGESSRVGGKGRGYRTNHLLSPFVRCGKCTARMVGTWRIDPRLGRVEMYACPSKGQGGCRGVNRAAAPIHDYIKALVIADHQRVSARKVEPLGPWPKEKELDQLSRRITESTRQYEAGNYPAETYFPSLARMEAARAELRREKSKYAKREQARSNAFENLAERWDQPDFTLELKQAAIAESLVAVVIAPSGKGVRFHHDQLTPIFAEERGDEQ